MKKYISIIIGIVIISVSSCTEDFSLSENSDTFFHVSVNKTALPVWVKGNTKSNKIIIYINGGPGLTSIDLAKMDMFNWSENLENYYAIAYYDQRGTGNAQGTMDVSSLTIDQYVKDLNAIISVIKDKYNNPQIFLMSHSFGSAIATNYLLTDNLQDNITGWISIDGAFNFDYDLQWVYRRDFLINIANEEINEGNTIDYWQEALQWTNNNLEISTREQKNQWSRYVYSSRVNLIPLEEASSDFGAYLGVGFASSYNAFPAYTSTNLITVSRHLNMDVEGDNYINSVSQIDIPTLLIWGRYDDLIPPELGYDVFNNLGTNNSEKYFSLFEKSSHEPYISDQEKFKNEVSLFLDKF
ncbi:alpha/beta hydrolase [Yeosuana marina]|uniref:alpha/beta hydrolase n=1 Tax=Yeosuana marina TaxID=1565536 RepID=UPI0030EEE4EE|tara:strand:+ start:2210 stop:3274 length:1065 start_codon:yes stop_codon:yes gene_type:complete